MKCTNDPMINEGIISSTPISNDPIHHLIHLLCDTQDELINLSNIDGSSSMKYLNMSGLRPLSPTDLDEIFEEGESSVCVDV